MRLHLFHALVNFPEFLVGITGGTVPEQLNDLLRTLLRRHERSHRTAKTRRV
jgi:hypothetical protein